MQLMHTTQMGVPRVMPSGDKPDKMSHVSVSLRGVVMRLWPVRDERCANV